MALGLGAPCATSIGSSSLPGHRRAMALKRRAAARAPRARRRRGGFGSSKGSLAATSGATSALALEAWKGDVVVPNWLSNCLWALKVGQKELPRSAMRSSASVRPRRRSLLACFSLAEAASRSF